LLRSKSKIALPCGSSSACPPIYPRLYSAMVRCTTQSKKLTGHVISQDRIQDA
jgi:hypothetical protein